MQNDTVLKYTLVSKANDIFFYVRLTCFKLKEVNVNQMLSNDTDLFSCI